MLNKLSKGFFPITLLLFSCSTDIEFFDKWDEKAIMYGLIDPYDSIHSFRINKAFLNPDQNAYDVAKNHDSIYFDNIDLKLYSIYNGEVKDSFDVASINNLNKDSGIFSYPGHILYQANADIIPEYDYKLVLRRPETNYEASGSTSIINPNFSILQPSLVSKVVFFSDRVHRIKFTMPEHANSIDIKLQFFYTEKLGGNEVSKNLILDLYNNLNDSNNSNELVTIEIAGLSFYNFLKNNIHYDKNIVRVVDSTQYHFSFIGEHITNYIRVQNAQTGIIQSQSLPEYTNVNNGLGIISSKISRTIYSKSFSNTTIDSISCSYLTKDLNFLDSDGVFGCQ